MNSNLEAFISLIQERLDACAPVSEDEIARCIYIMLGKKIRFNPEYTHEGAFRRIEIYKHSLAEGRMEEITQEEDWTVICTDIAKLAEYIGNRFGVSIKAIKAEENNQYSHMRNRVTRKDGSFYDFDLYDDIRNIQSNFRTKNFGMKREVKEKNVDGNVVTETKWVNEFDYKTLNDMDTKLGFVSKDKPYYDEYVYFLKQNVFYFDSVYERMKFLVENISPYPDESTKGYNEQKFHHTDIIKEIMGEQKDLWRFLDCYTYKNFQRQYEPIIVINDENHESYFKYVPEEGGYREIPKEELSLKIVRGLWVPKLYDYPQLMQSVRNRLDEGIVSKEKGKELIEVIFRDYY